MPDGTALRRFAILGGSLLLFVAAHVLLFALYLPARHVQFSLPLVWALADVAMGWRALRRPGIPLEA